MVEVSCSYSKNANGDTDFAINATLHQITNDLKLDLNLVIIRGIKRDTLTLLKALDVCDGLSASYQNFIVKYLAEELHRTSNMPLKCPFEQVRVEFINNFL